MGDTSNKVTAQILGMPSIQDHASYPSSGDRGASRR